MATSLNAGAGSTRLPEDTGPSVQFIDRWIFVFMAVLFIATALAGFVPSSQVILAEVEAGLRPPLPPLLHIHAVLMVCWLLMLLGQTWLMATGRARWHMQLGLVGTVLAPAIIIAGFMLAPAMLEYHWQRLATLPSGADPAEIEITRNFLLSLMALQLSAGILFAVFVTWGLLSRRRDPEMHKRLMILATAVPLAAGIDRIGFLPSSYPFDVYSSSIYVALWITPMLAWDIWRHRRVHRAYIAWLALYVPAAVLVEWAWWHPSWMNFVERLFGLN